MNRIERGQMSSSQKEMALLLKENQRLARSVCVETARKASYSVRRQDARQLVLEIWLRSGKLGQQHRLQHQRKRGKSGSDKKPQTGHGPRGG
ncbi:MAG: hypothetical protein R3F14_33910 [Polyangiaceae bacterium]